MEHGTWPIYRQCTYQNGSFKSCSTAISNYQRVWVDDRDLKGPHLTISSLLLLVNRLMNRQFMGVFYITAVPEFQPSNQIDRRSCLVSISIYKNINV